MSDAHEELLQLQGAAFGYGKRPVISGVNLCVRRGDFLGIVGPNGAGKTTLLRGMIGQLKPLQGTVRLAASAGRRPTSSGQRPTSSGQRPTSSGQRPTSSGQRPTLGYVPQIQVLDPIFPVTVSEVVAMGAYPRMARLRPMAPAEKAYLAECVDRVGMASAGKRLFADLSAGQKQRVLIARALMARPDLLLLDEPTSGVDQAAEAAVMQLLTDLNRKGLAIVLICHEMDTIRDNVRDVIWVNRGRIERGSVDEMLSPTQIDEQFQR